MEKDNKSGWGRLSKEELPAIYIIWIFTIYSCSIISWQIDGEMMETVTDLFSWAPKSLQMVTAAMKLKDACFLKEKL